MWGWMTAAVGRAMGYWMIMRCRVIVAGDGAGMILRIAMAGDVTASAGSGEAMVAPAVRVAPVGPGTHAEEDAVIEVAVTVVAFGGA